MVEVLPGFRGAATNGNVVCWLHDGKYMAEGAVIVVVVVVAVVVVVVVVAVAIVAVVVVEWQA